MQLMKLSRKHPNLLYVTCKYLISKRFWPAGWLYFQRVLAFCSLVMGQFQFLTGGSLVRPDRIPSRIRQLDGVSIREGPFANFETIVLNRH